MLEVQNLTPTAGLHLRVERCALSPGTPDQHTDWEGSKFNAQLSTFKLQRTFGAMCTHDYKYGIHVAIGNPRKQRVRQSVFLT